MRQGEICFKKRAGFAWEYSFWNALSETQDLQCLETMLPQAQKSSCPASFCLARFAHCLKPLGLYRGYLLACVAQPVTLNDGPTCITEYDCRDACAVRLDGADCCATAGPSSFSICGFRSCMRKFHGIEMIPEPQTS